MQYDFLQSDEWMKFQEAVGRETFCISTSPPASPAGMQPSPRQRRAGLQGEGVIEFWANVVEHKLPIVGGYFYVPRGPILNFKFEILNQYQILNDKIFNKIQELINLAKKENAGWIRFDAANEKILEIIKKSVGAGLVPAQISKAPHDMQSKEIFVIDISKSEDELLAEMKAKTRYNIKLAEKKEVRIKKQEEREEYIDEFLRLNKIMARRQNIKTHPDEYYRKMFETISGDILKLYIAEYQGKIIAANLMVFYGNTCTYLHGASDEKYRNAMVPYLLQWQAIKDAKEAGCEFYDFGGVKTKPHPLPHRQAGSPLLIKERGQNANPSPLQGEGVPIAIGTDEVNSWAGITKFKIGFSPKTAPVEFLGSYDIILNPLKYNLYRIIQKIKSFL